MLIECKLKEIVKKEWCNLIAFSIILMILIPFIYWYAKDDYNPTKSMNLLGIFSVYLILILILQKKIRIIIKLKWVFKYYIDFPNEAQLFLQKRKVTLKSYYGKISLFTIYEEAINMFQDMKKEEMCG